MIQKTSLFTLFLVLPKCQEFQADDAPAGHDGHEANKERNRNRNMIGEIEDK